MEMICIDYLTLHMSKGNYQYFLVITDHFTRYAQAVPTRNMSACTTADALFNTFIVHYGFPARIHSDQGANFESRLIRELCSLAGIEKSSTTPHHPMGNGMCERFNRSLMDMLGTLKLEKKKDWKNFIGPLVHAYNSTPHSSTSYSPFFFMFGREARLPIDVVLGVDTDKGHTDYCNYVTDLQNKLRAAHHAASEASKKLPLTNDSEPTLSKSTPAPRRSTREKRHPEFWRYGDFIAHSANEKSDEPEWLVEANFLASLA